jgi:hypothetical protein
MDRLLTITFAAAIALMSHPVMAQSSAASAPAAAPETTTKTTASKSMSAADCKKAAQMRHDHTTDRGAATSTAKPCPPAAKASSPAKGKTRHDHQQTK